MMEIQLRINSRKRSLFRRGKTMTRPQTTTVRVDRRTYDTLAQLAREANRSIHAELTSIVEQERRRRILQRANEEYERI